MSDKNHRITGSISLALGLVVLIFILILTALHAVGTDGALYYRLQSKERAAMDVSVPWGVGNDTLRALDDKLAAFLAGDFDALRADVQTYGIYPVVEVEVYGEGQPAFSQKEMAHLTDCYNLFALLRKVRARLIPWAVLLIVGGAYLLRFDRRSIRRIAWLSPLIVLLPLSAFALYALSDFDRAFTLFHKVLFRNDLWLLDPRTDLLIRICPEAMFMHMGARIAAYSLIGIFAVSAIATLLTFIWPKEKEENTWKTTTRRGPAPKRIDFGSRGRR